MGYCIGKTAVLYSGPSADEAQRKLSESRRRVRSAGR